MKWVRPQIMACIMVSLHRKYGFGYDRCARIYQQIQDILDEHGNNPVRIRKACLQETGINVVDGKVTGDWDYDTLDDNLFITPNPGGTGKLTTYELFKNLTGEN